MWGVMGEDGSGRGEQGVVRSGRAKADCQPSASVLERLAQSDQAKLTETKGHEEVRSLCHQALVAVEDPVRDHSAHGRLAVGRDNCEFERGQSAGAQAERGGTYRSEGGRGLTVGVDSLLLGSSHLTKPTDQHVSGRLVGEGVDGRLAVG